MRLLYCLLCISGFLTVLGCGSTESNDPGRPAVVASNPAEKPYIAGLTAEALNQNVQRRGLTCQEPRKQESQMRWSCALAGTDDIHYRLEFLGTSPTRIEYVTATVTQSGTLREEPLMQFLGLIAASSYEAADPQKAHQWTDQNVRNNEDITIGGVKLRLSGPPTARMLEMFPVGSEWE